VSHVILGGGVAAGYLFTVVISLQLHSFLV